MLDADVRQIIESHRNESRRSNREGIVNKYRNYVDADRRGETGKHSKKPYDAGFACACFAWREILGGLISGDFLLPDHEFHNLLLKDRIPRSGEYSKTLRESLEAVVRELAPYAPQNPDDPNDPAIQKYLRDRANREFGSHHLDEINTFPNLDSNAFPLNGHGPEDVKISLNSEVEHPIDLSYADPEGFKADERAFWESRAVLRNIRDFARASLVSPWAMGNHCFAITLSAIPPYVVLPGIVGDVASLNYFGLAVGESGEAKSTAIRAGHVFLTTTPDILVSRPGSAEGLAKCYAFSELIPKPLRIAGQSPRQQTGTHWSVLALIPEIDTLIAASERSHSILSELRGGWSGERLGGDYSGGIRKL